jgi:hypothetical protein
MENLHCFMVCRSELSPTYAMDETGDKGLIVERMHCNDCEHMTTAHAKLYTPPKMRERKLGTNGESASFRV